MTRMNEMRFFICGIHTIIGYLVKFIVRWCVLWLFLISIKWDWTPPCLLSSFKFSFTGSGIGNAVSRYIQFSNFADTWDYFAWKGLEKVLEVFLKILQIGTLGPMAWIIIEETEVMAIRFSPVGEINLYGKNLALSQAVRKMNFSSRKLAENQAGSCQRLKSTVGSQQLSVGSRRGRS